MNEKNQPNKSYHENIEFILTKIIKLFFILKLGVILITVLVPLDYPHIWRQTDTIGVAIRYWLRWTIEPNIQMALLPAALNLGDSYGIIPMEFPILNIIVAPFFYFGPKIGTILAKAFLAILCLILVYCCYKTWKGKRVYGVPMELVCLGITIGSISSVYFTKFMPDFLSMILVFLGISIVSIGGWKISATALLTLGLLIKPTSFIVFGFILLFPEKIKKIPQHIIFYLIPVVLCLSYYIFGIKYIRSFVDSKELYMVEFRNPLESILNVFHNLPDLMVLLVDKLLFLPGLLVPIFALFIANKKDIKPFTLLLSILFLQIFTILILDGKHSFVHEYYYIGTSPIILMLLIKSIQTIGNSNLKYKNIFLILILVLFSAKFFNRVYFDIRNMVPYQKNQNLLIDDCQYLKEKLPHIPWNQGYSFRSETIPFPKIGICFFERIGAKNSKFGLYEEGMPIPEMCLPIKQKGKAIVVKCEPSSNYL